MKIQNYVDDAMAPEMSTAAKVGSFSATLTQPLTPGAGGCLDSMRHALNLVDQNVGVMQHSLTGFCNVVGT